MWEKLGQPISRMEIGAAIVALLALLAFIWSYMPPIPYRDVNEVSVKREGDLVYYTATMRVINKGVCKFETYAAEAIHLSSAVGQLQIDDAKVKGGRGDRIEGVQTFSVVVTLPPLVNADHVEIRTRHKCYHLGRKMNVDRVFSRFEIPHKKDPA